MITFLGVIGMALILLAFFMNQTHRWKDDDLIYDITNLAGGVLLVVYAVYLNSWPFFILNCVWVVVSARDVYLDLRKVKKTKKSHLWHTKK
ncbi:hypothetical protein KY338_04365 [Candidatus Woesearchaeota archaeon]|nr:hypothetical protein [Candidatus Woesearchaeota archaeon]MBW3005784.1 hypothetical protein [Candidatus Woesearchaeota archaeon]